VCAIESERFVEFSLSSLLLLTIISLLLGRKEEKNDLRITTCNHKLDEERWVRMKGKKQKMEVLHTFIIISLKYLSEKGCPSSSLIVTYL
jgi:hypothetical protein